MKALSLRQPWASLMAFGEKEIETRGWRLSYRGPLVICATATIPRNVREWFKLARQEPTGPAFDDWKRIVCALARHGIPDLRDLPLGAALCIVNVVDCQPTLNVFQEHPGRSSLDEKAFGDYSDGRWAFVTENLRTFPKPIPCKGKHGLWDFNCGPLEEWP